MKKKEVDKYRCPATKEELSLKVFKEFGEEVISGELISKSGKSYSIINGLPNLIYPEILADEEQSIMKWYDDNYEMYDEYLPLTFNTFKVEESMEREKMISELDLKPFYKVLETGAGTGRDSILISNKLGENGELHVTEIHHGILEKSFPKLLQSNTNVFFSLCNAIYLPYPDNYFDCYYHFGGFNTFSDKKRAFAEISRVVKPGGKVIVGDESMPSWLRETDFGKILMNSNPHYNYELPLEFMHVSARNVSIKYIIGGVFYFISYTIGSGEPYADFDFEIPGLRGGTHRTRYYGHLEGVKEETKKLACEAREKSGKSMHKWLDDVIRKAAKEDLDTN